MGYIVTTGDFPGHTFDDEELPLFLETRRESFVLSHDEDWGRGEGGRDSIEIPYEWLPYLRLYVNYLEEKHGR